MRLVVTGVNGQVSRSLADLQFAGLEVFRLSREELDLANPVDALSAIARHRPDVLVNAGAYTAVDAAETDEQGAYAVNARGAGAVAAVAADLGIPLVQISTDYVFGDGERLPLSERAPTRPLSVYGASKLEGEFAVAAASPNHAILRTSWVYARFGQNFVRTMLRLASTRDEVRVVADQHGKPTSAHDIAVAIVQVAGNLARRSDPELRGVFNLTAGGQATTWAGLAEEIFRASRELDGPSARVVPITTAEYPTAARRPAWSVLDGQKLASEHGVELPDWRASVQSVVEALVGEGEFV